MDKAKFKQIIEQLLGKKKTSVRTRANELKTTNPYTKDGIGNRAIDDRYMNLAISKRNWQLVTFGLLLANIIMAFQLGSVAVHSKIETRVALVDDGMVTNTLQTQELTATERTKIMNIFLRRFITEARLVSSDEIFEKAALANVYARVSDQALQYVNEYYRENDPFKIAAKNTVSVEIVNLTQVSPDTWQIWWDETKHSVPDGGSLGVSRWYAQLSFKDTDPNPQHIKQNPLGIYITQLTWSKSQ